jgi:membrane associated rhomboid family serine protease
MLGRIDPTVREEAPASPEVIRALHRDLVRQKRRTFLIASPLLLLAGFSVFAGLAEPPGAFGQRLNLVIFGIVIGSAVAHVGWEWITLRRADPLALNERERADAERHRASQLDHGLRSAAVRPVLTLGLLSTIVVVTGIQFVTTPLPTAVAIAGLVKPVTRGGEWWRLLSATYLHGNLWHLGANAAALLALGRLIETYDRPLRVSVIYLAAALGGGLLSTLVSDTPSIGASGGILGLAGYLIVVAGRQPGATPPWIRKEMLSVLGWTAVMGIVAYVFIDNVAHLGGAVTGAVIGAVAVSYDRRVSRPANERAGVIAAAILLGGALFTITRLIV